MINTKQLKQVYKNDTYRDFRDLLNKAAVKYHDRDAFVV